MKPILRKQLPPTHIKIEFTEGCNLYCKFCPIQSIRKGPGRLKFMEEKTLDRIISQIKKTGWNKKLELTGHGEPLLNKQCYDYYYKLRKNFPNTYMFITSNGGKLLAGKGPTYNIDRILKSINVLALDDYKHSGFIPKVLESYKGKHKIYLYPEMPTYTSQNPKHHYVVIYPDISKKVIKERCLSNTACNSGAPNYKYINKTCHRPFRELNISYSGEVMLCCYDWQHEHIIGNINEITLKEIWHHKNFRAMRRILHHEGRKVGICHGCDNRLYRIGLLPDRMGKYTLAKPNKNDRKVIAEIYKSNKRILLRQESSIKKFLK